MTSITHNTKRGTVTVSGTCQITGRRHSATVPADGYAKWKAGTRIQIALAGATRDEREWLLSQISPDGWYQALGADEDDEDFGSSEDPATTLDLLFAVLGGRGMTRHPTTHATSQHQTDMALMEAIRHRRLSDAESLIRRGADVNARGGTGHLSVLEWAVFSQARDAVNMVINAGAHVNARDGSGGTALHLAIDDGSLEVVERLIDAGGDLEAVHDHLGTPLRYASSCGKPQVVARLLKAGADIAVPDANGLTPLHASVIGADVEVAEVLLAAGASPYALDSMGWTPLRHAVCAVNHPLVACLVGATPELLVPMIDELSKINYAAKALDVLRGLSATRPELLEWRHFAPLFEVEPDIVGPDAEALILELGLSSSIRNAHPNHSGANRRSY